MHLNELLQQINEIHGMTFILGERYATGEQGAFAVSDRDGRRGVLKWMSGNGLLRLEQAKTVTDMLRSIGYPAPFYLCIGMALERTYSIQLALPGLPLSHVTTTHLPRLLELNALQVGRALPGLPDWHHEAIHTVLFGGNGYCLQASLQHYSSTTACLLSELQSLVARHRDTPHRMHDLVHNDFNPANILVHDQQISGIIDWDASYAGDCIFDIATLLFYGYDDFEVREQLWQFALEQASLDLLSVYLAHLMLRQVDWSLRYHDQTTIDLYLNRSDALLRGIAYLSHQ